MTSDTPPHSAGVEPLRVWPAVPGEDAEAFEARLRQLLQDWEAGFDAGASWYSRDERVRIWDGTPVPGPGLAAYEPQAKPWLVEQVDTLRNEVDDVQVLRAPEGGLVVTVTLLRNVGRLRDGTEFEEHMRETLVWAERDGQWRVVHEHTSHLPESA